MPRQQDPVPTPIIFNAAIAGMLPTFSGLPNEDIIFFMTQFEEILNLGAIPEKFFLTILKTKLKDKALEFCVSNTHMKTEKNYENFKENMIKKFKKELKLSAAEEQFFHTKQKPNQMVDDFVEKLNEGTIKYISATQLENNKGALELAEKLKLSRFIDGLRPDIRVEVKKNAPKKFTEAVEIAKRIENAFDTEGSESVNINNIKNNNEETAKMREQLQTMEENYKKQIELLTKQIHEIKCQNYNPVSHQKTMCKICKKDNHLTNECWYNNNAYKHNRASTSKPQHALRTEANITRNKHMNSPRQGQDNRFRYYNNYSSRNGYSTHRQVNHVQQRYFIPQYKKQHYNNKNIDRKDMRKFDEVCRKLPQNYGSNYIAKKNDNQQDRKIKNQMISSCKIGEFNNLPIIKLNINGIKSNGLLDSGAAVSLMSPTLFEELKQGNTRIKYLSPKVNIQTLDQTPIHFKKAVVISFKIEDKFVTNLFYVTKQEFSKSHEIILGYDFLKQNQIIIDCAKNKIMFSGKSIQINDKSSLTKSKYESKQNQQDSQTRVVSVITKSLATQNKNPTPQNTCTKNKSAKSMIVTTKQLQIERPVKALRQSPPHKIRKFSCKNNHQPPFIQKVPKRGFSESKFCQTDVRQYPGLGTFPYSTRKGTVLKFRTGANNFVTKQRGRYTKKKRKKRMCIKQLRCERFSNRLIN